MERLLSLLRMHWDHKLTPNPSQEGNFRGTVEFEAAWLALVDKSGDKSPQSKRCRAGKTACRMTVPRVRNALNMYSASRRMEDAAEFVRHMVRWQVLPTRRRDADGSGRDDRAPYPSTASFRLSAGRYCAVMVPPAAIAPRVTGVVA